MTELFTAVFGVSLTTGAVAALLMLVSPLTVRRYASKWRYWIWAVLALRLLIPINLLPAGKETPAVSEAPQVQAAPVQTPPAAVYPRIELTIPDNLTEPIEVPARVSKTEAPAKKLPEITPLGLISAIWAVGAVLCLSVQFAGYIMLRRRVEKYGSEPAKAESEAFERICEEMKIVRKPKLMLCERAPSPMIIGFLKPRLILTGSEYSEEQLRFILRHELIHYRRGDVWFKLLFALAVSAHWFNPIVWIMRRRADVDMELSVDEGVVGQSGYEVRKAYSEALFSTVGNHRKCPSTLSTNFCGGKKVMKKRFYNILKVFNRKNGALLLAAVTAFTVLLGTMVGCSVGDNEKIDDPLKKANEIIETMKSSGDLGLANGILVFDVGSEYADEVQEHGDITLEVNRNGETYDSVFIPMKSPYDTKESCMEALGKVFTKKACQKREECFEEDDGCRIVDGVLYYEMSEPPHYTYVFPFKSAEKVSEKEIVAKTDFVWQDDSLSDCEITFKKEGGVWKIDSIVDLEAQRDDKECYCAFPITIEVEPGEHDYTAEAEELMNKLRETVGEENVFAFETNDFDGDGKAEAFCATGSRSDYQHLELEGGDSMGVTLWFVTENGAERITEDEYVVYDGPHLLDLGDVKFYTIELSYGEVSYSHIYGVKDGEWYEDEFSGKVSSIKQTGGNSFIGIDEGSYDAFYDENGNEAGGHTFKPYYFYYDGGFKEYGGIEITREEFLQLDGADAILYSLDGSGAEIRNIIYRGGAGVIIINTSTPDPKDGWTENHSVTVAISGRSVERIDSYIGVIEPAMYPELAMFPLEFDPSSFTDSPAQVESVGMAANYSNTAFLFSVDIAADYLGLDSCDDAATAGSRFDYVAPEGYIVGNLTHGGYVYSFWIDPQTAEVVDFGYSEDAGAASRHLHEHSEGSEYIGRYNADLIALRAGYLELPADNADYNANPAKYTVLTTICDGESGKVYTVSTLMVTVKIDAVTGEIISGGNIPYGSETAVPVSFDPEATKEALSLDLWDNFTEADLLLMLCKTGGGEWIIRDGREFIPLAEEYDTMEECEALLEKVFTRDFRELILHNQFGRHRQFIEDGGKMYCSAADFAGTLICDLPIKGAVYTGVDKMTAVTTFTQDHDGDNVDDYLFYLEKEDGSWKIASIERPNYYSDGGSYFDFTQNYYYTDWQRAEESARAILEDDPDVSEIITVELCNPELSNRKVIYLNGLAGASGDWSNEDIACRIDAFYAEYVKSGETVKEYLYMMYDEASDSFSLIESCGGPQVFPWQNVAPLNEIPIYGYAVASSLDGAKVSEFRGIMPDGGSGTWYIVELGGVEYYYAKGASGEAELCSYAIFDSSCRFPSSIKVGYEETLVNSQYPLLEPESVDGSVIAFNGDIYPHSDGETVWEGCKKWSDRFDGAMFAEIVGSGEPLRLALMLKDGKVAAVTYFPPSNQ